MSRVRRSSCVACLSAWCLVACAKSAAWSDHASLLWPLVREDPALTAPTLVVETLEDFVAAELPGLAALLDEDEAAARLRHPHYAPRPDALALTSAATDPTRAFLVALRVNPTLGYRPYVQRFGDDTAQPGTERADVLRWSDLSILPVGTSHREITYFPLQPGERVSPAQVVATASDEPDMGIDIGLFEDNDTPHGARYGFGRQPFGNPNLVYGSQAPFHMGFYHLDWLTRTAQPDLERTYPARRVELFGALARYAFSTGHAYWGWRFAGWALHYIGDLSQPYHAVPLPGVGTPEALWLVARGRTAEAVQLVSNRHGVLESYQHQRLRTALAGDPGGDVLLAAMLGAAPPPWTDDSLLDLTLESAGAAAALDAGLEAYMPPVLVSDPTFEWTGSGREPGLVEALRAGPGGAAAVAALDALLVEQLVRFARYSGAWIDAMQASREGN